MRTTLDIDDELLARAKEHAARKRSTLTRMIEESLALRLRIEDLGKSADDLQRLLDRDGAAPPAGPRPTNRWKLPIYSGKGGLRPEVGDATTNQALFDAADDA